VRRYYLNVQKPDGSILEDPDGSELPNLQAAREEAIEAARLLLVQSILGRCEGYAQAVIITDEQGCELDCVPLSAVLPKDLLTCQRLDA
jgi:hypothetical protein